MTPPISFASTNLGYPLYELEFDPYSRGYLLVGGGGGGGNAGVPNRLNLVDVSSRAEVASVAEITLSSDEDSVSSLASLATKEGLTAFAGVSSSVAERSQGNNDHFRSFTVQFPEQTRAQAIKGGADGKLGSFKALGKSRLLSPKAATGKYMNQKLLRLSPPGRRDQAAKRVGAVASREGAASEIAVFDATTQVPDQKSVRTRIDLEDKDAADLDLFQTAEGAFSLAYATDWSVRVQPFTHDFKAKQCKLSTKEPVEILKATEPGVEYRCLRWLGPRHVVVAANNKKSKTSELLTIAIDLSKQTGQIISRKRLPGGTKNCTTMDVCLLDEDLVTGERQIIVAVAGSDGSIHLYAADYQPQLQDPSAQLKPLRHFETLKDVHSGNGICKLAFSNFYPPQQASDSPRSAAASTPAYAKLASVAVFSDAVVVESIALTSTPTSPFLADKIQGTQKKIPAVRYVLSSAATDILTRRASLLVLGFAILISAFLLQGYVNSDPRVLGPLRVFSEFAAPGAVPPLEARMSMASRLQNEATPSIVLTPVPESTPIAASSIVEPKPGEESPPSEPHTLSEFVALHSDSDGESEGEDSTEDSLSDAPSERKLRRAVVVCPHPDSPTDLHVSSHDHDTVDQTAPHARPYHELSEEQQAHWKTVLETAGRWTASEGEAVLKSVMFSEYAAVVGGGLRDAILH